MRRFLVPMAGFALVSGLATLLIWGIVLTSPDTHAHLWDTLRHEYDRTAPIIVGQQVGEVNLPLNPTYLQGGYPESMHPGRTIYLSRGCATCHGLNAEGGSVGPSVAGTTPLILERMVREGPGGMLAYDKAHLTDADLATLEAYLLGLAVTKPTTEELFVLQRLTYDPAMPLDVILQGKAALRRSCGACHTQPTKEEILSAFGSDSLATGLVAQMVQNANVSVKDGEAIAHYMMAILHGDDPVKEP